MAQAPIDPAQITQFLVEAWTDALGTTASPNSDFFALGGSSLAAVAIATALAERYDHCAGLELAALQAAFECPSLRAMAEALHAFMLKPGA